MTRFMKDFSLKRKLVFSYLCMGLMLVFVMSFFYYNSAKNAIIERTFEQLKSIKTLKKNSIEQYLIHKKNNLNRHLNIKSTKKLLELNFKATKHKNTKSAQTKSLLLALKTDLEEFNLNNEFLDVVILNDSAQPIFSLPEPNKSKNISPNLIQQLQKLPKSSVTFLESDTFFKGESRYRLFIVAPIFYRFNFVGHILAEINQEDMEEIMTQRTGMGNTGESYVVSINGKMRFGSRFIKKNANNLIRTEGTGLAFKGKDSSAIFEDYRKIRVLSSFSKLQIDAITWAFLSEIDLDEAMKPIHKLREQMIVMCFFSLLALLLVTFYVANFISLPLTKLTQLVNRLAEGDFSIQTDLPITKDEIGKMNASVLKLMNYLKDTTHFAEQIGKGNFKSELQTLSAKDHLGKTLIQMQNQLADYAQLLHKQNQLKMLSLVEGQENERKRIAKELHDGIGQMLTAMSFFIQTNEPMRTFELQLKQQLDEIIAEIRTIAANLMPQALLDFGLATALNQLVQKTGIHTNYTFTANQSINLTKEEEIALYRIVQEAFQNIIKHSKASEIILEINISVQKLQMKIEDNGIGFDTTITKQNSLGMKNMEERILMLGGSFVLISYPNRGTKLHFEIPLN
jgi:two-component system, NarL family, sensor kinase